MPSFKHTLFGVGPLCDKGCSILFEADSVTIFNKTDDSILLQGWREPTGTKLWRFSLLADNTTIHHIPPQHCVSLLLRSVPPIFRV
jgi:hypothetical protein